jgi:hypothetical protein
MFFMHNEPDYGIARKPDEVYEVQADYECYEFRDYLDVAGDRIVSDSIHLSVAELLAVIQSNIR